MAKSTSGKTNVSLTLRRLILSDDSDDLSTGEVVEAIKAEAAGLIEITSYRDDRWQRTETRPAKWVSCDYRLTQAGEALKEKLISGEILSGKENTDPELMWLLEQAGNLRFEGEDDPVPGYDEKVELQKLADYTYGLFGVSRSRLGLPATPLDYLYISDRIFGGVLSEVMTAPLGVQVRVSLVHGGRDVRDLVSLNAQVEASGDSRYIFRRALEEYPRAVASILQYGSAVKFGCNVGYENEPPRRAPTVDHLKAYFAADDDDEENCWLEFDASWRTTRQTIQNAMTVLLAFHEAARAPDPSEALLKFHMTIQSRRRVKPS